MLNILANIIWLVFVGGWSFLVWFVLGLLWCLTIIGIPVGKQCFKLSTLSLWPFGKDVQTPQHTGKIILNVLWLLFGGIELALAYLAAGLVLCCTIVGIPFGLQCFKLAKLSLLPLGAKIVNKKK